MQSESKTLFQSFVRRGFSDRDALFALMDYWADSNHSGRERQQERIALLEADIAKLTKAVADLKAKVAGVDGHTGQT
ncbi:hypothetical protein J8F10_09010 [Gemmata sp. G18]|uniref:Uncharacterized protein n=1 Tax=Gemmata palustris TaxID=2822762 RepID=A0ABS5BNW6_9BACT|nr:hypothetical protein [Gemmata palustris]MBP3955419.1 hypothetical protein [Gemmata palustris]